MCRSPAISKVLNTAKLPWAETDAQLCWAWTPQCTTAAFCTPSGRGMRSYLASRRLRLPRRSSGGFCSLAGGSDGGRHLAPPSRLGCCWGLWLLSGLLLGCLWLLLGLLLGCLCRLVLCRG